MGPMIPYRLSCIKYVNYLDFLIFYTDFFKVEWKIIDASEEIWKQNPSYSFLNNLF